jgi:hypothetical protein
MAVIDPYVEVSDGLKQIIDSEFAPEGFVAIHDRLHESLGDEGTRIGISPEEQAPQRGNEVVLATVVLVQFYGKWNKEIDNAQIVDPRRITGYAARFRQRVYTSAAQGSSSVWYYKLLSITYPKDPTGNKTRFEAQVQALGDNTGLTETTG